MILQSPSLTALITYGIASLIGLFLGVISFFYYICHAFCEANFSSEFF